MHLTAGKKLQNGKYVVDAILNQRELSTTLRAHQVHLNQPVILTTLGSSPETMGDTAHLKQSFIETARRFARCQHPGLARVVDLFEEEGQPFVVLDCGVGQSLARLAQVGEFSFILAALGVSLQLLPPEGQSLIVEFLRSPEAQRVFVEKGYRSVRPGLNDAETFPQPPGLFEIDAFGGWDRVSREFFDPDDSVLASIFEAAEQAGHLDERRRDDGGVGRRQAHASGQRTSTSRASWR